MSQDSTSGERSEFGGNVLPPFPVDPVTLDLLWSAMHPGPEAEKAGIMDVLDMLERMGGTGAHPVSGDAKIPTTEGTQMETIEATPARPVYTKTEHERTGGTRLFFVNCHEGWRTSIVCERMYEWAADWLVGELQGKPFAPNARP